jgi:hypothetical protein
MDLERMLRMCREGQWSPSDLDWSQRPRLMAESDEIAIVQLFTDMAAIERLAGALFVEQERRTTHPILREIFSTFVKDEVRHAQVAQMLADHYDVHHLRVYRTSLNLERFFPAFVDAIRLLSDDVANSYITCGELILDVALLRSLDDYVGDAMSAQAMALINRDESRHIAVDYHMVEYYASDEYRAKVKRPILRPLLEEAKAWTTFAKVLLHARPFFRDVFFEPMERVDPSGLRLREAFKRMQLVTSKPSVQALPFIRFMHTLQAIHNHPRAGARLRSAVARVAGAEPRFLEQLASDEEIERARQMSFDALADEALAAKHDKRISPS